MLDVRSALFDDVAYEKLVGTEDEHYVCRLFFFNEIFEGVGGAVPFGL